MAGQCFLKCIECSTKAGGAQYEQASLAKDAGDCYKNVNTVEAITWYRKAIADYCDMGRFNTAAKMQMTVAELCEADDNREEAIINFQQAADFFAAENQKSHSTKAQLKVAEHSAYLGSYDKAIEVYESVAAHCLESNLLKSNARGHFLNAGFCALCTKDGVRVEQSIEKYKNMDVAFEGSRECDLLEALTQDYNDLNAEDFSTHLYDYDNISKLDKFRIHLLVKIQDDIKKEGDEADDLS